MLDVTRSPERGTEGYAPDVIKNDQGKMAGPGLVELAGQLLAVLDEFSAHIAGQIRDRVPFYAGERRVRAAVNEG